MANKTVLVVGATGRLGRLAVKELRARGAVVRAGVRGTERDEARALRELGAELVELDLASASPKQLGDAVTGAFAVVSTVQGGPDIIVDAQARLLEAARDAGVTRLFPSDYSFDLFALPEGVNINSDWRRAFAARAEQVRGNVEVVHLMQGMFADSIVAGFVGL